MALLAFRVAADESTIRLKQIQCFVLDELPKPPAVALHLPGRYRNPDLAPEGGQRASVILPERLLEP